MNRSRVLMVAIGAALLVLLTAAIGLGAGDIGVMRAWSLIVAHLSGSAPPQPETVVVFDLRLPRALLTIVIGAALGAAGAVTQGLFRNALAEPSVLGVSMGAAVAAVLGFSFGLDEIALWITPLLAAAGAGLTLVLLFALAGGARNIVTLLLSGIAISSLAGALITLMLSLQVERWELGLKVLSWLMGSFEGRSWIHLGWGLPPALVGAAIALWLRRDLDVLHLGTDTAASLGVDLRRTRLLAIVSVGILVGTGTALAGVIGFIGLVVPHIARMIFGAGHARMLPASMLLGGFLLLAVDTLARSVTTVLLPPGVITSLLGAPFFLWLLRHHDRMELT